MAADLTLELDTWEGPLDLLLALARRQQVDLRAISVLQLVDQYLSFIERVAPPLETAADYLVMAAWLTYLKSLLLLPGDPCADADPEELTRRLQDRLERLDAMREAGCALIARDRLGRDVLARGAPEGLKTVRHTRWQVDFYALIAAYAAVQTRRQPVFHVVAPRLVMTLEAALDRVARLIDERAGWTALVALLPAAARGQLRRSAMASSFVAALELGRQGRVILRQAGAFEPLLLKAAMDEPS